jgi:hypothetical protein
MSRHRQAYRDQHLGRKVSKLGDSGHGDQSEQNERSADAIPIKKRAVPERRALIAPSQAHSCGNAQFQNDSDSQKI